MQCRMRMKSFEPLAHVGATVLPLVGVGPAGEAAACDDEQQKLAVQCGQQPVATGL
jgi:hypothetical protein